MQLDTDHHTHPYAQVFRGGGLPHIHQHAAARGARLDYHDEQVEPQVGKRLLHRLARLHLCRPLLFRHPSRPRR